MLNNNLSVLYVEDDPMSREVLDIVLCRVMGVEKLWMFEDSINFMGRVVALPERPNLILLDIHMRPHDGFQMLEMLQDNPSYEDCKIVAVTASVMNDEVALLKKSGFDAIIGKPIDVETFPGILLRVMQGEVVWNVAE